MGNWPFGTKQWWLDEKQIFSDDLKKRILWEIINTASFYSFIMNFAFPHFLFSTRFQSRDKNFYKGGVALSTEKVLNAKKSLKM